MRCASRDNASYEENGEISPTIFAEFKDLIKDAENWAFMVKLFWM